MSKVADQYLKVDPWTVTEEGFEPKRSRVSESMFCLANEFMGVRGYFEEGYSQDKLLGSYYNCLYEEMDIQHDQLFKGVATKGVFMPNAADWLYTRITLDGEQLDLAKVKYSGFVRTLDMKRGVMTREFIWQTAKGKKVKVVFTRFLSMVNNRLGCQRVSFTPLNFSGKISIVSGCDFGTFHEISEGWNQVAVADSAYRQRGKCLWEEVKKNSKDGVYAIMGRTLRTHIPLTIAFRVAADQTIAPTTFEQDKIIAAAFTLALTEGKTSSFDKMAVGHWEKTDAVEKVWAHTLKLFGHVAKLSYDAALSAHVNYWEKTWKLIDITIDGDPEQQQGMRFSIYQFYSNYFGVDDKVNLPCKGLTAEVYYGWIFWDTETYCIPVYMFMNPQAVRKLLMFRYSHLAGALNRAKELACRGARYPFCDIDGNESCGTWQHVDLEDHVNVAIFYAMWLYTRISGDTAFVHKEGIEMLMQLSRYFASRGAYSPKNGDFGIYGVMGPDEFHTMVNNNVYTNVMVKKLFLYTLEIMDELRKKDPTALARVSKRVGLEKGEPEDWKKKAAKLRINYDPKTCLYEQHDGFFDLPNVDVKNIPADQIPIYRHWPYIKLFRYNMIKQPDTLMLPLFFSKDHSPKAKLVNYEYYEDRCIHESSLSPGVHSILAAELGKKDEAYRFFEYMSRLDLDNFNRNTDQGLHVTSMSGAWLNVVNGFGGMRTDGERLSFEPTIPSKWNSFSFNINYRGSVFHVAVDKKNAVFSLIKGGPVVVDIYGKKQAVKHTPLTVPLQLPLAAAALKGARGKTSKR